MGFFFNLAQFARFLFWLLLIGLIGIQVLGGRDTTNQKKRDALIDQFQVERKSRVIALIHRQESQSILGVEVGSHIDIEDSEAILRAIRLTPDALAAILSEGRWTHDFPITAQFARSLGLNITTKMPRLVYALMDLYPQATTQRPSVIYVPVRAGDGRTDHGTVTPMLPAPIPQKLQKG